MIVVNPSINATVFHPSTSVSQNVTAWYNNNTFLGKINIYFSMWAGEKINDNTLSDHKNIFSSKNTDDPFHMLNYTSYDAIQISSIFNESFDGLRNVIGRTLCRGTDFQIMNSITSEINICDVSEDTQTVEQRLQNSIIFHDNSNAHVEGTTANQAFSDETRFLSSDTDTIFYLTDKRNEQGSINWTEFRVEFPVLRVENIYSQMFKNEVEAEELSHYSELIAESIKIAEEIANIAVTKRIREGKFDPMFHKLLRKDDKSDILIVTSPVGEETAFFKKRFQDIQKSLEMRGAYPYPLGATYLSLRQIFGASLLFLTSFFIFTTWKIAIKRRRAKIRDALDRCEDGLLSSYKGLDLILEIHFKDNCATHCELTESDESIAQNSNDDKRGDDSLLAKK